MIKPIVYHSIDDKEALERELMTSIPAEKRASAAKALMNIFSRQEKEASTPRKTRKRR